MTLQRRQLAPSLFPYTYNASWAGGRRPELRLAQPDVAKGAADKNTVEMYNEIRDTHAARQQVDTSLRLKENFMLMISEY